MIVKKTLKQLQQLNTRNLLAYYRAERKRYYSFISSHTCDCCGEFDWDLEPKEYQEQKAQYYEWQEYLAFIKEELNKREHVAKTKSQAI